MLGLDSYISEPWNLMTDCLMQTICRRRTDSGVSGPGFSFSREIDAPENKPLRWRCVKVFTKEGYAFCNVGKTYHAIRPVSIPYKHTHTHKHKNTPALLPAVERRDGCTDRNICGRMVGGWVRLEAAEDRYTDSLTTLTTYRSSIQGSVSVINLRY